MSVTVEKIDVLSFVITGAERLDPVRVMIENYEPGKGRITITCYGKAWTAAWFAMGGDDVQTFIKRVSNEYLIGYFDSQLRSTVDDDNDANLLFVKSEIIKLRREREIDAVLAREMWDEAENADDVKESCCCFGVGNKLLNLFGDDPWYADWPTVPNPKYQYLERVLNAVRDGLKQIEPNFDVNGNSPGTPDGWISCSERMPVIGELNWRTSFPLLVTCEIGVIPAYYGFVRVNGNKHYGFMESLKYGDDSGNHPQTNEYDLISNVTHWIPLPEPPQEVNRG